MDLKSYTGLVKSYDREAKIHHVRPYLNYCSNDLNSFKKNVVRNYDHVYYTMLYMLFEISSVHYVYLQIEYDDGEEENLILSNENVKYHVSRNDMEHLKLSYAKVHDNNVSDYNVEEMLALAASMNDCQDFEPGDIVWAKLTGICSILFSCPIHRLLYVDIFY